MSNFYKLLSHPDRLLKDHLKGVAEIALESHDSHSIKYEIADLIKVISMCHDFGKATKFFQDYITGKSVPDHKKAHGLLSAVFTYWILKGRYKLIGFIVVRAHHGNMKNLNDELLYDENLWAFGEQIESMDAEVINELNLIYSKILKDRKIEDFIEYINDINNLRAICNNSDVYIDKMSLEDFILSQYIYSLLLTADKSDLILGEAFVPKKPFSLDIPLKHKNKIIEKALNENPLLKNSHVFDMRNDIHDEMMDTLSKVDLDKNKIFSINSPTGTAKTMLSFSASFYIANKIYEKNNRVRPSVIYSLPFMSIIDQNHEVMTNMIESYSGDKLNDEDVLKFHSITPIKYNDLKDYDARFCFENWQSRIVSTTFIQLFNTIFKTGTNSIVNRFHKLANSVIIVDEVQVIDEGYFKIIKEIIELISEKYNIYFILVTATMPMILDTFELIPNKESYFKSLNRITMYNYSQKGILIEDFKNILKKDIEDNSDKSFLIILNTIKSSKEVYEYLKDELKDRKIKYLSTEIYPKRRLKIINNIKNTDEKYIVISTQLIEAGVDIDMDVVYRDLAPLDSLNQSAGRCNRNGIGDNKGVVKIYKLLNNDNKTYCSQVYPRQLISATEYVLKDKIVIEEKDIFELNQSYFKRVNKVKSNKKSDKLLDYAKKMKFEDFRKNFNLIENNELIKSDIVIAVEDRAIEILDLLQDESMTFSRNSIELKNLFRELRQFTASVSKYDIDNNNINYKTIDRFDIKYVEGEDYDMNLGIKRKSTIIC